MNPNVAFPGSGKLCGAQRQLSRLAWCCAWAFLFLSPCSWSAESVIPLPAGIKAEWDLPKAARTVSPTRERICINGLWKWQPCMPDSTNVPSAGWGYFKVPGSWPGITDYMQKDSQTVFANPAWAGINFGAINAAWYEREIDIPENWSGRAISIQADWVDSYAMVHVEGRFAGELRFPGGSLEISRFVRPGARHHLDLFVVALPLNAVLLSYTDSAAAREMVARLSWRGLCGDVHLTAVPKGSRIRDFQIETSVRKKSVTIRTTLENSSVTPPYKLQARILKSGTEVHEFMSPEFNSAGSTDDQLQFSSDWMPDELWDLHTPGNQFEMELSLLGRDGQLLDRSWKQQFGFRELWIDGRDFILNGKRIFLSAVPLDNAQSSVATAGYAAAKESLERLKSFGINYVYTHNYGCEPGSHLAFAEILRAADDVGMLVGFTQPHFSHYNWDTPNAERENGYSRTAAAYAAEAGNHPSVVFYVMSHNATGYEEDMNPAMFDGVQARRDNWASRNVDMALRCEAMVKRIDSRRIIYHHASGNLGVMHNSNFYPNFAPIQELDDWFQNWAEKGTKPAFTCEYGAPFSWDWTMYRGWHKGEREWGSARVPWEYCIAEWNAQFFGDKAYHISEPEKANLRWEAVQYSAGNVWHRWDYPNPVGSDKFEECYPVFAKYITSNWRAYRTLGLSGNSPWDFAAYWKLRAGVSRERTELKVDWENLQRPGYSADYLRQQHERFDLSRASSDWIPTAAATALIRNNRPLLAWIAGNPEAVTSKTHNFTPGEMVEKQLVIINNSREDVECDSVWSFPGIISPSGKIHSRVAAGGQVRIPIRFKIADSLAPGPHLLSASATFSTGETQEDNFTIHLLPAVPKPQPVTNNSRIALFDPAGETAPLLLRLGISADRIEANASLQPYDLVVIGRKALTLRGTIPDLHRVKDGMRVIVFEQTSEALEKRLGFRIQEYGLRQVFPRVPDHPILAGLGEDHLKDWRGSSTLLPNALNYQIRPRYGPTIQWAGLQQTRVWRAGNRGTVASVLIEKPVRGSFLPILDGGFSLQYSPLLEFREGRGSILFCQLDVNGRTEPEPVVETLVQNLFRYALSSGQVPERESIYAGESGGREHLERMGLKPRAFAPDQLSPKDLLIAGPGCLEVMREPSGVVARFLSEGGCLVGVGLSEAEIKALVPAQISTRRAEHISCYFEPQTLKSPFAGISPADLHNRAPGMLTLIDQGARTLGDGILATLDKPNVVLLQIAPWHFAHDSQANLRRTHRRLSTALTRLLANLGAAGATPLLDRLAMPLDEKTSEQRWLQGLYLDQPQEWDDPYRFFRW